MDLAGKGVIVAGGAGSIGRAVVAALLSRGANVVVLDANVDDPVAVSANGATHILTDAADEASVEAAIRSANAQIGKIFVLVNCAGAIHSEALVNLSSSTGRRHRADSWDRVLRSNLTATFLVSAHVAEHMASTRTKGVIINFSSIAAAGNAGQSAYSAAKAGVEALTAVWAKELGPLGIRVVALAPGFVDTPSTHAALSESAITEWTRRTALRRLAKPEEIAGAVLFAIDNDFLTGRTIAIDGGLTI
jgi:3-oxoacyl-[acyl-carrier protein] reductase